MDQKEIQATVRKRFSEYLEQQGQRKTKERFTILEEIYNMNEHFDVELLYAHLKKKSHPISKATVYNTLELLLGCDLVTRHQFGKNLARFEKSYAYKQHDHLICSECEHIFEFCDPRIQQIQSMMGDLLKFQVTHHSLFLFGHCKEKAAKGTCKFENVPS